MAKPTKHPRSWEAAWHRMDDLKVCIKKLQIDIGRLELRVRRLESERLTEAVGRDSD